MLTQNIIVVKVLFFLGYMCLNTVEGRTCILENAGRFSKPCGYCGVCKTSVKSKHLGICDNHYLETSGLFLDTQTHHCELKNYCETYKNLCKNDTLRFTGVCFPLFGTYLCECKRGFFGKNCEHVVTGSNFGYKTISHDGNRERHLAVVHNVVFSPIFYCLEYATILISLQSRGFNVSVYTENGREKLQYNEKKCETKFTTKHFCKHLFNEAENIRICEREYLQNPKQSSKKGCLMTLKIPFPRSFKKNKAIYQYVEEMKSSHNPIQGNLETVTVGIKNVFDKFVSKQVFEYTFNLINIHQTSDLRLHCFPKVRLINCGASMEDMPNISRYTDLAILRSVNTKNFDSVCQEDYDFTSVWNVWRIQENHDELKDKPLFKILDATSYVPNEEKLDYGVYKVKLAIIFAVFEHMIPEKAYCYFNLIRTPIQTTILGGSTRTQYYKKSITFDVASSVIPDRICLEQGTKVLYNWRCNDSNEQFCNQFQTSDKTLKVRGPFHYPKSYNFTVNTFVTQRYGIVTMEHPEAQVIKITSSNVLNLAINCLKNCGGSVFKSNPQEVILLEVTSRQPINENVTLHWKYKCLEDEIDYQDVLAIKDNDSTQFKMLIMRNKLKEGRSYAFLVAEIDSESSAEIIIETDQSPKGVVCEVFPESGIKGETMFTVSCKSEMEDDRFHSLTYRYEFYDRYEDEEIGRMVGYSTTGLIEEIMLTRDRFFVRTTNFFGTATEMLIKVNLSSSTKNFSSSSIESEDELITKDYIYRFGLISAYSDLLGSRVFWSDENQILLNLLIEEEAQPKDIMGALLLKNSLFITACDKFISVVNETDLFQCESILSIAEIMREVTLTLQKILNKNNTNWRILTTVRTKIFVESILKCSSFVLSVNFLHKHLGTDVDVHECLKESTYHTIDTLDDLVYIVSLQMPLIQRQKFEAKNIVLFVEEMEFHSSKSVFESKMDFTEVRLKEGNKYYTQLIVFNRNPFWWGSGSKINTNVYSFQLNSGSKHIKNPDIRRTVHFYLEAEGFRPHLVQGSVKQPDPKMKPQVKDMGVVVHRIDPESYSEIFIEFVNFIGKANIRVLILQGERPDFDLMTTKATEVTRLTRKWSFGIMKRKSTTFYYLGILPVQKVDVGLSVNYSFTLYGARCAVWKYRSWISGEKCVVNKTSDMHQRLLICSCSLLTLTLGGYVYNPIVSLNPFSEFSLSLLIPENTVTVSFLLIILILFSIAMIWTKNKDSEDKQRKNVLVLEDNNMNDSYLYLIAVFTGLRFGAGTTSNVAFKLFGETGTSKIHVFRSNHQSILQCGDDNWFLFSTPQHLGSLLQIKLWIDYCGLFPNWYCKKVTVCDLKNSEIFNFIIEKWFGINLNGVCLEVIKKGASSREVNTFRLIFFHNLIQGLRESHIFFSIFFKHPRSLVTRTQRLNVFLCSVLVAIVTTTLMYSLSTPIFEDYSVYNITTDTVFISFISGLFATIVILITMHYFRKSCSIVGSKFLTHSDIVLKRNKNNNQNKSFCLKIIYKYAEKYVSSCKVIPIGNTDNRSVLEEHKSMKNLAWMICLAIIFVSVYMIIMSSLTYGEVKIWLWLTSLSFTLLFGFFVLVPMKVLLIAVFLSILKIRHFDLMLHNISVNKFLEYMYISSDKNITKANEKYKNVRLFLSYSYISRQVYRYQRARRRQYRIIRIWILCYILEALLLLGVVVLVMGEFDTYKNYYANTAVCNEMMTVQMCANVFELDTAFLTLRFRIHEHMLPKLYKTKWYNGDNTTSSAEIYHATGWMRDANSRLVGDPHLIQVRVKEHFCKVPKLMSNLTEDCLPSLSSSTVDRDNYSLSWTHDDWTEIDLFSESPWEFVQGSGIGVRTPSDYYLREGGYVAALLRTLDEAKLVYTNLIDTNWIDDRTRVIVLEFVTYNVNNNMITSSYFVTETYSTSNIKVSHTIRSKSHYFNQISVQSKVFILFSIYFFVRTLIKINIMGVGNFFDSFWNIYDVFFSILYIVGTVKYIHLLYLLGKDEEKAETMVKNRHIYLEVVFQAMQDTIIFICYIFGVAALRLIRIARINDSCKKYLGDFVETRTELILTVMLSFSSMYIMFRLIMYYVEPTVYDFMDILVLQSDFHSLQDQYDTLLGKLSAYVLGRLSDITMFSFTISLLHHQRQITLRRISLIVPN